MKPKFSLQRILELRERKEQALAARLASARSMADEARAREQALVDLRRNGSRGWGPGRGVETRVGELQNASYALQRLDQQLDEVRSEIRRADALVNACLAEFSIATRDRQVLDRLKAKKREVAMLEAADADRKTMDAVALSRFFRGENPSTGSSE